MTDEKMSSCGGNFTVNLDTVHKFLKLDSGSSNLIIEGADINKETTFDDSYLDFKIDQYNIRVPILVSFVSCKIESLKFETQEISIDYEIGSNDSAIKLPELV